MSSWQWNTRALSLGLGVALGVSALTTAEASDAMLDLLIRKGLITDKEAAEVKKEADADLSRAVKREAFGPADIKVKWSDGLAFESGDGGKTYKGKIGGRVHLDFVAHSESDGWKTAIPGSADSEAKARFRRVRLNHEGEFGLALPVFYKVQLEFAESTVGLRDVYMGLKGIPVLGTLTIGQQKEPFSLEELTSSNNIMFPERATPVSAFAPSRNIGVMFANEFLDKALRVEAGWFTDDGTDKDVAIDSNSRGTIRLVGVPLNEDKGRKLVHLGLAGSVINVNTNNIAHSARPDVGRTKSSVVSTGNMAADMAYLLGAEAALVLGPFSLQGEYIRSFVDRINGASDVEFDGFYVAASWLITGEHRPYRSGVFRGVKPKNNFNPAKGGWGAWELTARYSYLDLYDDDVNGGRLANITGGVNWYLNPIMRMLVNYSYADLDRVAGNGHAHLIQTRFQVAF